MTIGTRFVLGERNDKPKLMLYYERNTSLKLPPGTLTSNGLPMNEEEKSSSKK